MIDGTNPVQACANPRNKHIKQQKPFSVKTHHCLILLTLKMPYIKTGLYKSVCYLVLYTHLQIPDIDFGLKTAQTGCNS